MRTRIVSVLSGLVLVGTTLAMTTSTATANPPDRSVTISGTGVSTYPVFEPSVTRYAVSGAEDTQLRVQASTSDPGGQVLVDGMPQGPDADVVVTGEPGDEVSVIFDDVDGRTAHSFFLLPDGFPTLEAETAPGAELDPGLVLLTLSTFAAPPFFETAVDRNGVPVHVNTEPASSIDLKRQPNGELTAQRVSSGDGFGSGSPVVVLGDDWQPTGETHETVDLTNTDSHDSILLHDGHVILMSYEPRNTANGPVQDAAVQELDDDGAVVHTWRTGDEEIDSDSIVPDNPDYAHINSVVVMDDGNWLLSFRHFSSVWKVNPETGEVIWKLGGRRSDFTFMEDEHAGPCAQHTASELPNGNILIYDNGGSQLFDNPTLCVDPNAPNTGRVDRPFTRITEYALDEDSMEATLVSEHRPTPYFHESGPREHYAYFAGGVHQTDTNHRLISWSSTRVDIATELDTDGQAPLWTLRDTHPVQNDRQFSYRAHLAEIEDVIDPTITIHEPSEIVQGTTARLDWQCRDRGGSGLTDCNVSGDGLLDTSTPGEHDVTVTATDAAGNETTQEATYVVVPAEHAVDAAVRIKGKKWKGIGTIGAAKKQQVATKLKKKRKKRVAQVRVTNAGNVADRFLVTGKSTTKVVKVIYRSGGKKVTGKVTRSGFRTPTLAPGASITVKVTFKRKRAVKRNQNFPVRVKSTADNSVRDAVRVKVKVRK